MAVPPNHAAPPHPISTHTIHMAGLLVDVHGLDELLPTATHITCLWLHHARTQSKENMADIAARCVAAWNDAGNKNRGLVALAFDQRNHGSRLVHKLGNSDWKGGNENHAQDMLGVVAGAVADQGILLDVVGGYLFHDREDRIIDRHLALGISLGGHSVWQTMFAEPRIRAGVVIVGCPDLMYLLSGRAKKTGLKTYPTDGEAGAVSFLGSRDFPPALVDACRKFDPKGILFGTSDVPKPTSSPPPGRAGEQIKRAVEERLSGKKFLLCSGGDDDLVPYRCSEPFLDWFKDAVASWLKDAGISVEDNVYPGVGHWFDKEMIKDAVRFTLDNVEEPSGGVPTPRI